MKLAFTSRGIKSEHYLRINRYRIWKLRQTMNTVVVAKIEPMSSKTLCTLRSFSYKYYGRRHQPPKKNPVLFAPQFVFHLQFPTAENRTS
mmetsp:Transcript_30137/g.62385  ORF Transcript_30137/g.62385 Transcript_30137/m.62385 type:complete len:90 (-) Transcript_30137:784-1053(-)